MEGWRGWKGWRGVLTRQRACASLVSLCALRIALSPEPPPPASRSERLRLNLVRVRVRVRVTDRDRVRAREAQIEPRHELTPLEVAERQVLWIHVCRHVPNTYWVRHVGLQAGRAWLQGRPRRGGRVAGSGCRVGLRCSCAPRCRVAAVCCRVAAVCCRVGVCAHAHAHAHAQCVCDAQRLQLLRGRG